MRIKRESGREVPSVILREIDKAEICKVFASRMTLGKTAIFAELNVGKALKALKQFEEDFHFLANPLPEMARNWQIQRTHC